MFQGRVFKVALVALVIISFLALVGLLVMGGLMARSSAFPIWRHSSMIEHPDEGDRVMPYTTHSGRRPVLLPALCGMGLLFTGLPLLLLVLGGIFFRHQRWLAGGRSWHDSPAAKGWHHGPPPPWFWSREKPSEEEMARMKNWHQQHGFISSVHKAWCEGWDKPAEEPPEEEPR